MTRGMVALLIGATLAGVPASAARAQSPDQSPRPAVVVQIAGTNLYLDLGADAGLRMGDTLAVRRAAASPPVGALVVVAATSRRSVLTFAGLAFPVTRGDTLYVTPKGPTQDVFAPVAVTALETQPRAPPRVTPATRVDGSFGLEMWGSHSETVGLGSNPVRTTRDLGMPAIRFSSFVTRERSQFRVNVRAQQRTGPESVWDRSTRIRIYEARYDRTAGRAHITAGRFFSDFDHQSAFWDGASVRINVTPGISTGFAAGFEPDRGNEEISFTRPKVAGFVGTRHSTERVDFVTDFAVTHTMPSDATLRRTGADLSMRLRVGRFSLSQDLEASPPSSSGNWEISRFMLRGSMPAGQRGYVYASAISDRFTPLDTSLILPFSRRERITSGFSTSTSRGIFFDVNASVNDPSGATSGYAAGVTLSVPRVIGNATASMHTSWFDDGQGTGLLASPALEYRLGDARLRGGYQFYQIHQPAYSVQTHGLDFRVWKPFGPRMNGVLQVTERIGQNMNNTTFFTSLEWRF